MPYSLTDFTLPRMPGCTKFEEETRMSTQAAGWYSDPYGRFQQRYWNGAAWTHDVATNGVQQVDPMGASTVIPIAIPPTAYTTPAGSPTQGFAAGADPNDPNAQAAPPEPAEPGNRATTFLDGLGPDARLRPRPGMRVAMAGLGGAVVAVGILIAGAGDDPSRGVIIGVSALIIVAAWVLRTFIEIDEAKAAAVGMVVVGIPTFATATTVSDNQGGFLTGLLGAVLFIAAWALPGFKSRNLLLGLGALTLVGAFGSLTSTDKSSIEKCERYLSEGEYDRFDAECDGMFDGASTGFLPVELTDNLGTQGVVYLGGAAVFLGLTWWLDRRRYHGAATGLCAAGLVSAVVGTGLLANEFGSDTGPILVLIVGLLICAIGTHGSRRATTWWGAALAAIGMVALVAVQWEPRSSSAIGGVAILSGLLLVVIPLVASPVFAAIATNRSGGADQPPPAFSPPAQ